MTEQVYLAAPLLSEAGWALALILGDWHVLPTAQKQEANRPPWLGDKGMDNMAEPESAHAS